MTAAIAIATNLLLVVSITPCILSGSIPHHYVSPEEEQVSLPRGENRSESQIEINTLPTKQQSKYIAQQHSGWRSISHNTHRQHQPQSQHSAEVKQCRTLGWRDWRRTTRGWTLQRATPAAGVRPSCRHTSTATAKCSHTCSQQARWIQTKLCPHS